jgi:acylphosphatase
MATVRCDIRFTGRVQGVGFRATAAHLAQRFDITGWVRNEPDGSVRCIAEGDRAEVDRFIAAMQEQMAGHIHDTRIDTEPAHGESGFTVRT